MDSPRAMLHQQPTAAPRVAGCGVVVLLLLSIGLPGCAKMGDPLPPRASRPATIQDLDVQESGGRQHLDFSLPPGSLEWVEIYRQCRPRTSGDRIRLIGRLGPAELQASQIPGRFLWVDPDRRAQGCRYALRFVDRRGESSDHSNFAPP